MPPQINYSASDPEQFWQETQQYLAQKRAVRQQQARAAAPLTRIPPAPSLPTPEQQEYIASREQQYEENKPGPQHLLELLGRPEAATRGAIQGIFGGANPVEGFMTGLGGGDVPGYSELAGVRDLPGPLPQAIEKAGSFVLDPLNLVPFGKLAGGARSAIKAIREAEMAAPAVRELAGHLPRQTVETALEEGSRQTAQQSAGRLVRRLPLIGPRVADVVSSRWGEEDDTIKAIMTAVDGSRDSNAQMAEVLTAAVTQGKPLASAVKEGRLVLQNGEPVAWNDVASTPDRFRGLLPEDDYDLFKRVNDLFRSVQSGGKIENAPILGEFTQRQRRIRDLYGDEIADRFDIPEFTGSREFAPRYVVNDKTGDFRAVVSAGKKTGQHERAFTFAEEGLEAGYRYADPIESITLRIWDWGDMLSQMEGLAALRPYIQRVGEAARTEIQAFNSRFTAGPARVSKSAGLEEIAEAGAYKGLWARPEDAELIRERLQRDVAFRSAGGTTSLVGMGAHVNEFVRTVNASGDLSAWFNQLLPTLARDPARGMAAMWMSLRAALDPSVLQRFYASAPLQDVAARAPGLLFGGTGSMGEAFAGMQAKQGLAHKFFNAPGLRQFFERSESAFGMAGDFARYTGARAMLPSAEREGTVSQMVDFLNHSTGALSQKAMGLSPIQRAWESIFMFAPRYTRASLALITDLANGKLAAKEAGNTLASMLVFGLAGYQALARAMDQQPELDPRRGNFLTWRVLDDRVGIGTAFRSLLQVAARVEAQVVEGKEELTLDELSMDNPLVRLARSRLSPLAGSFADIADGQTFIGTPIMDGGNPFAWIGRRVFPLAIGAFLFEHGTPSQKAAGLGAQFVGLRAFPEQRKDVLNDVARELYQRPYNELSVPEQARVRGSEQARALPQPPGEKFAPDRARDDIYRESAAEVGRLAARVETGGPDSLDRRTFRGELAKATDKRNTLLDDVERRYEGSIKEPKTTEGKAYAEYNRLAHEPGPNGLIDYEAADTFVMTQSPATQRYIKDRLGQGVELLPAGARGLVRELYEARETLQPYWLIFKTDMQKAGLWERWNEASPEDRDEIRRSREYARVQSRVRVDRDRLRLREPEIDELLVRWGYVATPIRERGRPKPKLQPNQPATGAPTTPGAAPETGGPLGALRVLRDQLGRIIGLEPAPKE